MKTSELIGSALNHAVHLALGLGYRHDEKYGSMYFRSSQAPGVIAWDNSPSPYSTDWSQGGPIIEREKINLEIHEGGHTRTSFYKMRLTFDGRAKHYYHQHGPTPLIAAMRCFVAFRLGDEVDVPGELL